MSASLAALLNRRVYVEQLEACWARDAVAALTDAFYDLDPIGLTRSCLRCPRDEYEPEAVLTSALLLELGPPDVAASRLLASTVDVAAAKAPDQATARAAVHAAFAELFGPELADSALEGCSEELVAAALLAFGRLERTER